MVRTVWGHTMLVTPSPAVVGTGVWLSPPGCFALGVPGHLLACGPCLALPLRWPWARPWRRNTQERGAARLGYSQLASAQTTNHQLCEHRQLGPMAAYQPTNPMLPLEGPGWDQQKPCCPPTEAQTRINHSRVSPLGWGCLLHSSG